VLRNVVLNAPEEPIKLKSTGGVNEPSGALIFHNTFVSAKRALNLQTPITQHNFRIENNLFVGPKDLVGGRTVEWTAKLNGGVFDYNGYYPDGGFWFGVVGGQNQVYGSWSEVQSAGVVEQQGVLLASPIFAAGFVGPEDEKTHQSPVAFALAPGSNALDRGRLLDGINRGHGGSGPDLGAWEKGCPEPVYGPRAPGQDGMTSRIDCEVGGAGTGGTGGAAGSGGVAGSGGGSGGVAGSGGGSGSGGVAGSGDSGSGGSGGSGGTAAASGTDDADGGCGCRTVREPTPWPTWVLGLVAPLLFFYRRRGLFLR
jgi:MYXO-CTERM domain-containing protein